MAILVQEAAVDSDLFLSTKNQLCAYKSVMCK